MIILRNKRYTAPIAGTSMNNTSGPIQPGRGGWGIINKATTDDEATQALGLHGLNKTNEINNTSNTMEFLMGASQMQGQIQGQGNLT